MIVIGGGRSSGLSPKFRTNLAAVPYVLVASDSPAVHAEVKSVLPQPEYEVLLLDSGAEVLPAAKERTPDLVICDLMIAGMGGMATCLELRLETSGGRLPDVPVLLLLDRRADTFLAQRSGAQGWVVKPLDPIRLRKGVRTILAGERYEDTSFKPTTVPVA